MNKFAHLHTWLRRGLPLLLTFALTHRAHMQEITVEGSVVCEEQGSDFQKRPARYIIVVPEDNTDLAEISTDFGYYKLLLPTHMIDQNLTLYFIGKSDTIETQRIFVSREALWNRHIRCDTKYLEHKCESFESNYLAAKSRLNEIQHREYTHSNFNKDNTTAGTATLGNLVYLISLAGFGARDNASGDSTVTDTIGTAGAIFSPPELASGRIQKRSFSEFTQNTGFHFTADRDFSEAMFWNAATLVDAANNLIALQSDYQHHIRLASMLKAGNHVAFGFGVHWLFQHERRRTTIDSSTIEAKFRNDELVLVTAASCRISPQFSVGLTPKLYYQRISLPASIERERFFHSGELRYQKLSLQKRADSRTAYDLDASVSFSPISAVSLGMSVQNIFGTTLRGHRNPNEHLRAIGTGVVFRKKRLHIGGEINLMENNRPIYATGINYVPANHVLINAGYVSWRQKIALGMKYRGIFYSYNRDDVRHSYHIIGAQFKF